MSSPASLLDSHPWPFSLDSLVHFCLHDPFTQSIVTSAGNCFFAPSRLPGEEEEGDKFVNVRRGGKGGWTLLPKDWRDYFESVKGEKEREEVLRDLANGRREDFPPSLTSFLYSCRSLSLNRTCSPEPVLSFPPSPSSSSTTRREWREDAEEVQEITVKMKGINTRNAEKAGQGPKKEHEVKQLSKLVQDLLDEGPLTHCVDVGSGRAHLSRALACPPLNLHVLAIDWSSSQKAGAEILDSIREKAQMGPTSGSLTHEVTSLDADGVLGALSRWPPPGGDGEPALLVALHACGDLTPDALKAFVRSNAEEEERRRDARMIAVGCCYNMQTPSLFPLSSLLSSLPLPSLSPSSSPPPIFLTRAHLRLTPQSPPTWHLTPTSTSSFYTSTLKIAFRARFEAELEAAGVGVNDERRVGRIAECKSWGEYRKRALGKYDYGVTKITEEEVPGLRFVAEAEKGKGDGKEDGEEWETALFWLRCFWTIRSWLGPPLETLCVLDRFAFLCEGMRQEWEEQDGVKNEMGRKKRRVEVVNVFDQATNSLRNLAIVVR
ncbi:hypothetical protein JCM8547_007287 [Rhodosporidiobolus lusitaniae]